ncbi:DNA polymerase III subunit gamma/tau [Billgrantia montanilacus]|uniref:DNA polymerase III subunit gamma/tau n=1 Tax=Billgrantia montanilacus TaxID=2282305 RepID=A0A368TU16_9GAMM|nr:DNA polymerase III subunit gamma/tau [Halomonas montanilacus]RCV87826.1 DNA polymerase III subunit gamma/tau [Halomonas montanilacus]
MSYQVLARKWRPRTFHELVGQEHVQRALVNALDQGRLHHAYLFTGTRGVGKTTLARILAKCLNCTAKGHGDEGVTSTPCGECDSCRAIDEGRFVDLIEVDAASRTKVEDTRELLDNVQYAPTQGRYKVYLIDEVHMLSTSSFNALLKTLEEPPPHVKFLLATTDPQKLPPTVLSRCLQFTLKNMPPERIVEHLGKVLEAEQVGFEESALWLLGKAADGSMRDAMSLTDQAIAFGQGQICHVDVAAMLGTLDHRHVVALVEALAEVDAARVLNEVSQLAEQGPDFAAVLDDVTGVLHRLAVAQMVPGALDNSHGDRDLLLGLAARFTPEDIQLYYQIGIQGRGDMAHAPDLRTALEMTLLRMLAFRPQGVPQPAKTPLPLRGEPGPATPSVSGDGVPGGSHPAGDTPVAAGPDTASPGIASPDTASSHTYGLPESEPMGEPPRAQGRAEAPPPWEAVPDTSPNAPSAPPPVAETENFGLGEEANEVAVAPPPAPHAGETVVAAHQSAAPRPANVLETAPETTPEPTAVVEAAVVEAAVVEANVAAETPYSVPAETPTSGEVSDDDSALFDHSAWLERFDSLGLGGLTRNLAAHCVVESDNGTRLLLRLDPSQDAMNAEIHVRRVQDALAGIGVTRQVIIEAGPLPEAVETPRQRADRIAAERHAVAVEALEKDPHVRQLQEAFGARLITSSVKPAEASPRA